VGQVVLMVVLGVTTALALTLLGLKQAKIPSPQGIYLLVDDDVSSLSCPQRGR
jgi:hypothetical protein